MAGFPEKIVTPDVVVDVAFPQGEKPQSLWETGTLSNSEIQAMSRQHVDTYKMLVGDWDITLMYPPQLQAANLVSDIRGTNPTETTRQYDIDSGMIGTVEQNKD